VSYDTRYQTSKPELWSLSGGIMENRSSLRVFRASGQGEETFLLCFFEDRGRKEGGQGGREEGRGRKEGRKRAEFLELCVSLS
jgi:hypothetical protein